VIRSPRDKDTEAIWQRRYVKKLSPEFSRLAYNKLALINAAETINDLGCSGRSPLEIAKNLPPWARTRKDPISLGP
jgi:hypothetical protein